MLVEQPAPGAFAGPHESLVVEAGREQPGKQLVDRAQVEGQAGPAMLAARIEPVDQFLGRGKRVGRGARTVADGDEGRSLLETGAHDPARPVILEAARDQPPAVGQQRGCQRIAGETLQPCAIEREPDRASAIDSAAALETIPRHGAGSSSKAATAARAGVTDVIAWVRVSRSTTSQRRQPSL